MDLYKEIEQKRKKAIKCEERTRKSRKEWEDACEWSRESNEELEVEYRNLPTQNEPLNLEPPLVREHRANERDTADGENSDDHRDRRARQDREGHGYREDLGHQDHRYDRDKRNHGNGLARNDRAGHRHRDDHRRHEYRRDRDDRKRGGRREDRRVREDRSRSSSLSENDHRRNDRREYGRRGRKRSQDIYENRNRAYNGSWKEEKQMNKITEVHTIFRDGRQSFFDKVDVIRRDIKCELQYDEEEFTSKNDRFYITLESKNPEDIDEARTIVDKHVIEGLRNQYEDEEDVFKISYHISQSMKFPLSTSQGGYANLKGWSYITNELRTLRCIVTVPKVGGPDSNPPLILEGTPRKIKEYKLFLENLVSRFNASNKILTEEIDVPEFIANYFKEPMHRKTREKAKEIGAMLTLSENKETLLIRATTNEKLENMKRYIKNMIQEKADQRNNSFKEAVNIRKRSRR